MDADRVLLEALADAEVPVRRAAAEAVARAGLKSPAAVQALAKALGDADRDVRLGAAAALGALPADVRPLRHLLRAYEDDDVAVMRKAAEGLARYGKPAKTDLPLLGEALGSAKLRTRLFAVTTLAEFGRDALPVLDVLGNAVGDADPTVRRLAVGALRALGTEAKGAAPAIALQLKDKNARVRLEAAATLVALKTDAGAVVPVLLEAAIDKDGPDRPLALESLRRLGDWAAPAVPYLIHMTEKEDARAPACDALVAIGKPAVEATKDGLRNKDAAIRQALVEVLGRIGRPARTALLEVNTMALRDPVPEVRTAARKASDLIQKK
jgi:HEAT repeat protein